MSKFKIGETVAIDSRHMGGEVVMFDGDMVTVKLANLDIQTGRLRIWNETFKEDELRSLKGQHGVIVI